VRPWFDERAARALRASRAHALAVRQHAHVVPVDLLVAKAWRHRARAARTHTHIHTRSGTAASEPQSALGGRCDALGQPCTLLSRTKLFHERPLGA
jgi:hypothetical protein